jgi:hypothetical protein
MAKLSNLSANKTAVSQHCFRSAIAGLLISSSLLTPGEWHQPLQAAVLPYCQIPPDAVTVKENLLQAAIKGNSHAESDYQILLKQHAEFLRQCRDRTWPQEQAIWLRLYPCDVRPGSLDTVLDRIVNRGYNTVYLSVFSDSQVLLPAADNPTPWDSLVQIPGTEKVDLLAQAIQKGHERGLKIYAWLFTLNFGYVYAQRPDRQGVLARNGKGDNSLAFVHDESQAFIDPYHPQAQADYYQLLAAILRRRPDGVLFDYIRYPRGTGTQSVVGKVKDLWIYGEASRQALYNRAQNPKGRALIERYLSQGAITVNDIIAVDKLYPQETSPLWQGRTPPPTEAQDSLDVRYQRLKYDLWYLAVGHAAQGVLDFLSFASSIVQQQGIPAGAVFFPDGNQVVGNQGFDSRLQPWDKFSSALEWHPMSYALCHDATCVVNQVKRVTSAASPQTRIIPAIAGLWGHTYDRPSLETQMSAIRASVPQIQSVSHFAFSWQEPDFDKERRFCRL